MLYRFKGDELQVLLAHPGGPFWKKKDEGAWSIPKGVFEENETPFDAAKREFKEETGFEAVGNFINLGSLRQSSKKIVHIWAVESDLDETKIVSNKFALEWPKNSGNIKEYPEIDKVGWFNIEQAKKKLQKGQVGFIDRLLSKLGTAQTSKL